MSWYVDKFTKFFDQWKKGYICTRNEQNRYGIVKELVIDDDFENSKIIFTPLKTEQKNPQDVEIALKAIVYFRAADGPLFNVGKYLSIIELQRSRIQSTSKSKVKKDKKEKDLVCVAFGLEFYTSPGKANALKANVKDLLLSELKDLPLVLVKDEDAETRPPVHLTPHITRLITKLKGLFSRKRPEQAEEPAV